PNDHKLLHKILAQYEALQKLPQMYGVLRAIADSDSNASRKARVVIAMGHLVEEKLGDKQKAIVLYDEALTLDFARLEAFERIVKLLTAQKDWRALEKMYL